MSKFSLLNALVMATAKGEGGWFRIFNFPNYAVGPVLSFALNETLQKLISCFDASPIMTNDGLLHQMGRLNSPLNCYVIPL